MRILFITDAWLPQINGVVRTLQTVSEELAAMGHEVTVIGPDRFLTLPLPTYAEIRVALAPGRKIARMIEDIDPDAIHIATEGPLGWAARNYCVRRGYPYTTSYHTRFPEYIAERAPVPVGWSYAVLRRFHQHSSALMVATGSIERALAEWGFRNLRRWSRGVDTALFRPRPDEPPPAEIADLPRPWLLYVGRVAVEKNVAAFLRLRTAGSRIVVGDGPQLDELKAEFPRARFVGTRQGEALARFFSAADVFVFPSCTDTFGLVLLEALASGVPVAAFPVPGPLDILGTQSDVGALDEDLDRAVARALTLDRDQARSFALGFSWRASAEQFLANIHPFRARRRSSQRALAVPRPLVGPRPAIE